MAKSKAEKINLKDKVSVTATDKHPFADKGEKFEVHPKVAEQFLKKGYIDKYNAPKSVESEEEDSE